MANNQTKFKETEIGTIPEEWDVFDIQTVSDVVGGGTPSTTNNNNFNGEIPWITPRDLSSYQDRFISRGERCISEEGLNSSNAKLLPVNTVLLTTRAPVGYLAIAKNEVTTNQGFHSLIPNNKTNSLFLFYLLKNNVEKLISNASGSTFQELNGKTLKSLEFAFPRISEQEQIAEILSSLDDKIELNRKINANLEKIASALFKRWFVDIGDELPERWKMGTIGDFGKVKSGFAFKGECFNDQEGVPVIKIKNIIEPNVDLNNVDYVSDELVNKKAKEFILEAGDILIAMSGNTTGKIGIMPKTKNDYVLNQRVGKYFLKDKNNLGYVYFYLRSGDIQENIIQAAYGSAQPNISPSILENIKIIIPDNAALNTFNNVANNAIEIIVRNNFEINVLTELRDSILPRLMSGKIRVKI
ncbi:restriction endonuclease subunit S [Patescibacteria group bacterium]|nr:restriction endonuclease subunit S [Patescibacteria group bacterium]